VRKVAAVYLFIFRSLMEANFQRDEGKLDDALKVLRVERETWRQVCKQLGTTRQPEDPPPGADTPAQPAAPHIPSGPPAAGEAAAPKPGIPASEGPDPQTSGGGGLSLEA